jgi:hypothetical protein
MERLWGCYSVADHLADRAFVADLLLYDRLVVPVPAEDDRKRWEVEEWNPDRQAELLEIAKPFVKRVEWSASLRAQFDQESSASLAAVDIDEASAEGTRPSPFELTRRVIAKELRDDIVDQKGDVVAVGVYAQPDRFDREWQLVRQFPFIQRDSVVTPGELREVTEVSPADRQRLAKLVVTRLVVPDDGADDHEVLRRTVDLISDATVAERRAAFQQLIGSLAAKGRPDKTVVGEVEDLLTGLNESIKKRTKRQRARIALHVVTTAEGAAALWAPPVAIAIPATAAVGELVIKRRWGDTSAADFGAVSLLADAQRALQS